MNDYAPVPAEEVEPHLDDKTAFPPTASLLPSHHRTGHVPHEQDERSRYRRWLLLLGSSLCVVVLLGASYRAAPLWQRQSQQAPTHLQAEHPAASASQASLVSLQSAPSLPTSAPPTPAACTNRPLAVRPNNVNPTPRPPPPCTSPSERYLTYENHSGFFNQLDSLTNALFLAEYLNRTLLLPPARLGVAAAWQPALRRTTELHERCKALMIESGRGDSKRLPKECRERHADPSGWTYFGWDAVLRSDWLAQWPIVDRWNGTQAWLELSREEGGMGFVPDEMHSFEGQDVQRLSYQLYETRTQPDSGGGAWSERIDLPDLLELPQYTDKKLLHFGSLFGEGRIDLGTDERSPSWARRAAIKRGAIVDEPRLARISDEIKERLGSYIGVHLRTTDGQFRYMSQFTFPVIFRQIAHGLLGVEESEVDRLLALSEPIAERIGYHQPPKPHKDPWSRPPTKRSEEGSEAVDAQREADEDPVARQTFWPTPNGYERPISQSVVCRGKLYYSSSPLYAMNQPIYIATDAREPEKEAAMVPFLQHFPCLFFLSDFGFKSDLNKGQTVRELEGMFRGERKSDWDGQRTAPRLFGFLDAMLAAKGDAMIGTPSSSFSAYAFDLHKHYVAEWKANPKK